jgi:hypothetical protein
MDEPGEQCTVVFALIATEQASEYVCGRLEWGSVTIKQRRQCTRMDFRRKLYNAFLRFSFRLHQIIIEVHKLVRNRRETLTLMNYSFM